MPSSLRALGRRVLWTGGARIARAMKVSICAAALGLAIACSSAPPKQAAVRVPVPLPSRSIAELQAALGSTSAEERRAAAWELAAAGPAGLESRESRDALTRMREGDPDAQVRLAAEWALGHLVPTFPPPPGGAKAPPGRDDAYDTPPSLVQQTRPIYPPDAYAQKIAGRVEVEFLIDEQGDVAHAQVSESIPALDAAAVACVRGWKFKPAMKGGRPVPTMAVAPVTFNIY